MTDRGRRPEEVSRSTIGQNIPSIGGRNLSGVFFVGIIPSVALTPFFAFREIGQVLGERELHSLIFTDGAKAAAFQSGMRQGDR